MTPITQPMVVFDEKRAINRVAIWVALARHRLGAEWSREWHHAAALSARHRDIGRRSPQHCDRGVQGRRRWRRNRRRGAVGCGARTDRAADRTAR